jgi:hypothetical protein
MRLVLVLILTFLFFGSLLAEEKKALTYQENLQPLLREKCAGCHNADKKQGGLDVTNYTKLMEGGGRGKVIEPGDPEQSTLYLLVSHKEQPTMPPTSDKIPDKDIALIASWIKAGALENSGSSAQVKKPKVDLTLKTAARGKPEGPPPMPAATLALDLPVKAARGNAIVALASSPWAPLVAVAGPRSVLLYNVDNQDLVGVLSFPEGQVNVLKFSRNGALLLAGGGRGGQSGKVIVWDIKTGNRVIEAGDEHDAVLAADISPDQTQIALGGPAKMVRIYSTKDSSLLYEMKKHTDWLTAVEYSPDGVLLATGDRNGGLAIWETATGREYLTPRGPQAAVTELSWRPDGNLLAASSEDTQIRLFEMENGNQVKGWGAHGGGASSVRYHHDGRLVSTGRDRATKVWNGDGALQKQYPATTDLALRAAWSSDGTKVLAGDWNGQVRIFASADAKDLGTLVSNPPPLDIRLTQAMQKIEAARTKHAQATAQLTNFQNQTQKITVEVAQAQEANNALKTAQEAVTKANNDATLQAWRTAQGALPAKELAAARLVEIALKAKEVADKLPSQPELTAFATQSQALAAKQAAELAAAKHYATQLQTIAKPAQDRLNAASSAVAKAQAAASTVAQQVAAKQNAAKAAGEQIKQLQQSIHGAEQEIQQLQVQIDHLQKAAAASKQKDAPVSQK